MQAAQKLNLLAGQASYDLSCSCDMDPPAAGMPPGPSKGKRSPRTRGENGQWIYPAALPAGNKIRVLKVLQDNSCKNDCTYCAQRAGRNTPRDRFEPEELAQIFNQLHLAKKAEGIFLSSGIGCNPIKTMDRMLATTELIRRRYKFFGYIHLKILPGAELAQIEQAACLAQRISINIEAPNEKRLNVLSKEKKLESDIMQRMQWISNIVDQKKYRANGHTTQFIVGAAQETDSEIVSKVFELYDNFNLPRPPYSKFNPVPETPLEEREPVDFMREHRLYQTDFLIRKYGFKQDEIIFEKDNNLSLDLDPKTVWAKAHPELFPIEINQADANSLLRIPGIGPTTTKRIIKARKSRKIKYLSDLKKMGATIKHAGDYLLCDGQPGHKQLSLF